MRLLVTGTPGVGKTTVTKALAKLLNAELIDVNAVIKEKKLFEKKPGERKLGEREKTVKTVKLAALKRVLERILKTKKNAVAESHLLCEMRLPCDAVIVLRCDPRVLDARLRARGYPLWKVRENVLCETLDYCLIKALEHYGGKKVRQIDFTEPLSAKAFLKKIRSGESVHVNYAPLLLADSFKKRLSIF